ncbi:putative multiple ankyrin repeats single kh domain protein [Hypoxylon sp. NC1633]|nr:putative multiple ankyrin repeats single kh domain protein [Hypoxylon sp. NC1633]
MSKRDKYTVGWICAVDTEYVAAQEFLDEEHEGPDSVERNDNNTYTLGRIGKHNVVIASLPHWQYGLVSAAAVARDMVHSFPNVRVGLMVGIGGGAPSQENDIRLGDIVVSSAGYNNGGVIQYDYGATVQNKAFSITGFLNQPPTLMLGAIQHLKAQHTRKGHQFEDTIAKILHNNPRLQDKYRRPDPSTDRLYVSSFTHAGGDRASCTTACGDDKSTLVPRKARGTYENNPAIHYGLIASANQLMKDALIRDRLATEKGVLCFEMEAAGLMNHFPCLVIRGICDYSDTHKNTEWQGYAAMMAAAYAKDLLNAIAPNRLESELVKASDIINVQEDVKQIRTDVESLKIRTWLSPPDPSTNLNTALRHRNSGSGQWLLRHTAYHTWKSEKNSFLWLHGIPGCGKTILSSTVIEDVRNSYPDSYLYFYFAFNDSDKQHLENAIRSLIFQLYYQRKEVRKCLDLLHSSSCKNGTQQPSLESLCTTFQNMVQEAGEVWIVLDALDECSTGNGYQAEMLQWIQTLRGLQMNIHLLVTSRPEQHIEAAIENCYHSEDVISIPIKSNLVEEDIRTYIHAIVRGDKGLERWQSRPKVQTEIETALLKKADGMFRWVSCQLDALRQCYDYPSVRQTLESLPKTLDETYARILANIPQDHRNYTMRILQFLIYSERPLRIEEIVDIIAVKPTHTPSFDPEDRMPVPQELSRYCSSLVMITEKRNEMRNSQAILEMQLAHYSVREYLTSGRLKEDIAKYLEEMASRTSIAETCLSYISQLEEGISPRKVKRKFPLAQYAAQYWTSHAVMIESRSEKVRVLATELLSNRRLHTLCHQLCHLHLDISLWDYTELSTPRTPRTPTQVPTTLCFALSAGLVLVARSLIDKGEDTNAKCWVHGNALQIASYQGYKKIVEIMIRKGAIVNAQGEQYGNALQAASCGGHKEIVRILLNEGARVNAQGGKYGNALQAASYGGNKEIVQMLLDKGAKVNAEGGEYDNALRAAAYKGHKSIVQLLLSQGAEVNAMGNGHGNSLEAASYGGHEDIVRILLDNGAAVDVIRGKYYRPVGREYDSALQAASYRGHRGIIQILLDNGADINAENGHYGSALQAAICGRHKDIVQMLLDNSADPNVVAGHYGNSLWFATSKGDHDIVRMLLDHGAKVNASVGYDFRSRGRAEEALPTASYLGFEKIVQMLLDKGAKVDSRDQTHGSALEAASRQGNENIVQMLLNKGLGTNTWEDKGSNDGHKDEYYCKALEAALSNGHKGTVQMLLDHAADMTTSKSWSSINAIRLVSTRGYKDMVQLMLDMMVDVDAEGRECQFGIALKSASAEGHKDIVQMLLDNGADVNAESKQSLYGNALQSASEGGHEDIVQMLVDNGADVNAESKQSLYGNALQSASYRGHENIVQILLDNGANVDAESGQLYSTALQSASYQGHQGIVQMLLDNGADVNAKGGQYGNALQSTSYQGHQVIVQMLLDNGADVNAKGGQYGTALQSASYRGHENIVQILLDNGANVDAESGQLYSTALQSASYRGHQDIVQMLLDNGADVNAKGGQYGNALQSASYRGHQDTVQMLLDNGADVNAKGGQYGTALLAASMRGYCAVSPHFAFSQGYEKTVKILLDKGADVNAKGGDYGNALQAASSQGEEEIIRILLDYGADVNAKGGKYGNALQAASYIGHKSIVQILLRKGAKVNAKGGEYDNALQAASYEGHRDIIQVLLDNKADTNARGGPYGNALQAASYRGHKSIVQILLREGAEVNAKGGEHGNALQAAFIQRHEEVIQLLLDNGADVNAKGGEYGNALQAALYQGREEIVQILLDKGADVNAKGKYDNAFQAASLGPYGCRETMNQMLLNHRASQR